MGGLVPALSERAIDALGFSLNNTSELLDVTNVNHDIRVELLNVINVLDAVYDPESIPTHNLMGRLIGFKKLAFIADVINDQHIFKISGLKWKIYVSDEFRNTIICAKLKGFDFELVWDSEECQSSESGDQFKYEEMIKRINRFEGMECSWSEAFSKVQDGKTMLSGEWKLTQNSGGILQIGRLSMDCTYNWLKSDFIPPLLLGLQWHEEE